jgi:periplasmic divalent cation tolerance protein
VTSVRVLLCTCPPEHAEAIASGLLERRLVACVNVIAGVASRYRWQGALEKADESLLILKTEGARVPEIVEALRDLHPYDVPELIALPVEQGAEPYLKWVSDESAPGAP